MGMGLDEEKKEQTMISENKYVCESGNHPPGWYKNFQRKLGKYTLIGYGYGYGLKRGEGEVDHGHEIRKLKVCMCQGMGVGYKKVLRESELQGKSILINLNRLYILMLWLCIWV